MQYRSNILIVIERCVNDFNYSAILRTAEALGVQDVWLVDPPPMPTTNDEDVSETPPNEDSNDNSCSTSGNQQQPTVDSMLTPLEKELRKKHHLFAQKATEWLSIREFPTSTSCLHDLRSEGYDVWATDLSQEAVSLTQDCMPYHPPAKIALVFGTEAVGVSQEMLESSDMRVYLPLRGFADSLNLSVATALVIHQVFTLYPE